MTKRLRSRALLRILKERDLSDWSVLLAGLQMGWIDPQDVVDEAVDVLERSEQALDSDSGVVQLAGADGAGTAEVEHMLVELSGQATERKRDWTKDAWRYALLRHLRETTKDETELLEKVAAIYRDFSYPVDMREAIFYMPPVGKENAKVGEQLASPILALNRVIGTLEAQLGSR
jgi:hypothetical protein